MNIIIVGPDNVDLELKGAKCCVIENSRLYVEDILGVEAYDLTYSKRVIIKDNDYKEDID